MADTKLTGLVAITSATGEELLYIVDDPGGTPVSRKITVQNLILALATGADDKVVSGTAGTNGKLAVWNADGDLVDGPTPPSGTIVGTSDSQTLTNKTIDADNNTISNLALASEVTGALGDLSDVTVDGTPAAGEVLKADGADGWDNATLAEAGIAAASHTHVEADITDLGTYLTDITGESFGDLSDVTVDGTPAEGEVITADGSDGWRNETLAEADIAKASDLSTHTGSTSNPHSVTAAQVDAVPEDATILSKSANYELAAGDEAKIIECDGTFTITCPDSLDTGFQVALVNVGSGTITVAAATTLQSKDSADTLDTQYAMATVYHRGSNVWLLAGDIA